MIAYNQCVQSTFTLPIAGSHMTSNEVRLTEFSHGAGCGCKIAPDVLETILRSTRTFAPDPALLVGNGSRDDAAAYDIGDGRVILSTTDFFMPIVDDPFDFGRIAATNAISDIYAMGGEPIVGIAILGWPVDRLAPEVAREVVDGGRQACADAGFMLAGGHSIDSPEPIFGLAVTGQVSRERLQQNNSATAGCRLYLTKPLGIGVLTTAQKQKKLAAEHRHLARDVMCQLNRVGATAAALEGVRAMTDVTGFGLLGHLLELCEGSGVDAVVHVDAVPVLDPVPGYIEQGCVPGGTGRNFNSYGRHVGPMDESVRALLCDPQTSGGLLIAVEPGAHGSETLEALLRREGLHAEPLGELVPRGTSSSPRIRLV